MSGWFGSSSSSEAGKKDERVYYTTVENLNVRAEAKASSKVVGRLRMHEKVTRSKEKDGYSFVRAREGSLEGWVPSARLDWRVPRAARASNVGSEPDAANSPTDGNDAVAGEESVEAASSPTDGNDAVAGEESVDAAIEPIAADIAPAETQPEAAAPASAAAAPAPPRPAAPAATKKKGVGASVFDPY